MRPAQAYLAIRIAMMGGLLLFGGITWFLHQRPEWQPPKPGVADALVTIGRVTWATAVAALAVLFFQHRKAENPVRASTLAIVAWSVGEALALFGVVFYYIAAVPAWYISGMLAMAITFVAFPPPALR